MAKNILITGCAGFIGFHLARHLKKRGDFVIGVDNFNDYYDVALKRARYALLQKEGIEIVETDISEAPLLQKLVLENEISHFVHLAAQAGVRYSIKHPEAYVHSNLEGFARVLEVCRRHPTMKLIFASSSSVYGLNKKVPFSESDPTTMPANLYGATKIANEAMAYSYHHLYGLHTTALRFFTVYGPWGRPDMAYYCFAGNILNDIPIQIFNEGQMQRDFTYIDDIVAGTVAAIDLGAPWEVFNLGGSRPVDVLTMVDILEKVLKKKAIRQLMPMQQGEVLATYADISKSKKMLGYVPQVSLDEGLSRFASWFVSQR